MRWLLAVMTWLGCVGWAEAGDAYACVRVVRAAVGEPSRPAVTLPAGYTLQPGADWDVVAPGEWHGFIAGPRGAARMRLEWPGVAIAAVIVGDRRLPMTGDPGAGSATVDVPVVASTWAATWSTLDVFSYPGEPDLQMRVEHNHPARRAGWYLEQPWSPTRARAMNQWIYAARTVLRDWGLHRAVAAAGAGRMSVLGYECVNPLHIDHPPHWHLIQYWPTPGNAGTLVPHYYFDDRGALVDNKVQTLFPRADQPDFRLGRGEPMVVRDPGGGVRFATRIRDDGGLDLGPAPGDWRYAIVAGPDGTFVDAARVLKAGALLATVAVTDDVARGLLTVRVTPAGGAESIERRSYDPLTGLPRAAAPAADAPPVYGMADPNGAPAPGTGGTTAAPGLPAAVAEEDASGCGLGGAVALIVALAAWCGRRTGTGWRRRPRDPALSADAHAR